MEKKNWMEAWADQELKKQLLEVNQKAREFGLSLSEEDVRILAEERQKTLKKERRAEFGESILPRLVSEFCDSAFLTQENYRDTLIRLQEIFFLYKNEMEDEITDDELLHFMREQFDEVCFGDLDYLEGTCLDIFAQAIRAGYRGYTETDGYGEFSKLDIVTRWDRGLYLEALRELAWR